MKNLIYFLAIYFILSGCSTDQESSPMPSPVDTIQISFPELHLTESKNMLPLASLTNGGKAVYVNQNGVERTFFISVETGIKHKIENWEYSDGHRDSLEYDAEYLSVGFNDSITNFYPYIQLTTQYGPTGKFAEILTAGLYGGTYFPTITIEITGRLVFGNEVGVLDLYGQHFEKVYKSLDPPPGSSNYSRLFYNYSLGIVAFEGLHGEMWALNRYEN